MSSTEDYLDSLLANAKKNTKSQSETQKKAESTLSDNSARKVAGRTKKSSEAELDALLRGDIKSLSDVKEDSSFGVQNNIEQNIILQNIIEDSALETPAEQPVQERRMTSEEIDALLASVDIDEELGIDESIEDPVEKILAISEEHIASEDNNSFIDVDNNSLMDEIKQLDADSFEVYEEPNIVEVSEAMLEQLDEAQDNSAQSDMEADDAGRMMSPDEIAAIIAKAGEEMQQEELQQEEVEQEELQQEELQQEELQQDEIQLEEIQKPAMEMDDPNKMMSPEDIEALLASMGGDDNQETQEEQQPDEVLVDELIENFEENIEDNIEEIQEPAVEMDDPNKMMSPEDIEALLASMGGDDNQEAQEEQQPDEILEDDLNENFEETSEDAVSRERTLTLENGEEISLDTPIGQLLGEDFDDEEAEAEDNVDLSANSDLDGLGDFSEDDIEKMLNQAADISDVPDNSVDEATDVTDLLDEIGTDDEDLGDIASTLKASDENVLVDNSLMDKLDAAEKIADDEEELEAEEDLADSKNKKDKKTKKEKGNKKEKKGNFISKLFGKKNKSKASDDMEDQDLEDENINDMDVATSNTLDDESVDTSIFEDILNDGAESGGAPLEAQNDENVSSEEQVSSEETSVSEDEAEAPVKLEKADEDAEDREDDEDDESSEETGKKGKNKKKKKDKKEKKPGLIARILSLLTEEVEDDSIPAEASEIQLSEENAKILAEIDEEEDPKAKKKKKKEEEKAKKKEAAAAKKAEKEKQKRKKEAEKKEKKKNAVDDGKKIPKKHVRASVIFALSVFAAIFVINTFVPKLLTLSDARKAFYKGDYNDAFLKMYGKDLNESDQLLYNKSRVVILLQRKYESYENYDKMGMQKEALNALLSGLKKYDEIIESATALDMDKELDKIRTNILIVLNEKYGVSEAEAMEVLTYGNIDYTRKLDAILNGTSFNKLADEINVKYGFVDDTILDDPEAFYNDYPDMLPEEKEYIDSQQSDLYEQLFEE